MRREMLRFADAHKHMHTCTQSERETKFANITDNNTVLREEESEPLDRADSWANIYRHTELLTLWRVMVVVLVNSRMLLVMSI